MLRWVDITAERIRVHGTGQRLREFPLAPFLSLSEFLAQIRAIDNDNDSGRVFS